MAKAGSPKGRRLRAEAQGRRLAASQRVGDACDVLVVGGGASGTVAAMTAAPGARTVLLEAGPSVGAPILATGNGRCNFSNEHLDAAVYNRPDFVAAVFGDDPTGRVKDLFRGLGLLWSADEGRLYPVSRSAASVRSVLVRGLAESGATAATLRAVTAVERDGDGFSVTYEERFREDGTGGWTTRHVRCRRLVWACGGGTAAPLAPLGVDVVAPSPVLCPVAVAPSPLDGLSGKRLRCRAALWRAGEEVHGETGELLLRDGSVSGILAFDLSRFARPDDALVLDLVPSMGRDALVDLLGGDRLVDGALDGALDPAVAAAVVKAAPAPGPMAVADLAKAFPLAVMGLAHTEVAQVTRGGVDTSSVDPGTLEVLAIPGLHVCGEALDVDGPCGGFNLGFAWLSGAAAGSAASASL